MRRIGAVLVGVALALAACDRGEEATPRPEAGTTTVAASGNQPDAERAAAVYAAVIRRLMTKDHTFGGGEAPFDRIFVVDGAVKRAGNPAGLPAAAVERFDPDVRAAIERRLTDLPPLEFVSDPDSVIVGRKRCAHVKGNGVLMTLGPISGGSARVTVPNGMFFACLGGQWLTYVLKGEGGHWRVVGTKGATVIS
jgi:hypothetical protein